jgi:hypothetical protein
MSETETNAQGQMPKTSKLAMWSFVLAIAGAYVFITAPVAIIMGIVSLFKIQKSKGELKGTSFAIAAIIIAQAGATWFVFVGMPRIRSISPRMVCGSNLFALREGMFVYACDYDDMFPTPSKWCDLLIEHTNITKEKFTCRGADRGPCNYSMNKNVEKLGKSAPPDMVLLYDSYSGWNQSGGPEILNIGNHKGDGCNILFVGGYVTFVRADKLAKLKWKVEENE